MAVVVSPAWMAMDMMDMGSGVEGIEQRLDQLRVWVE